MNAHQRRVNRRSRKVRFLAEKRVSMIFDIEAISPTGRLSSGGIVPQDLFLWPYGTGTGCCTVHILKERQLKPTGERFTFSPDGLDMDFTELEKKIVASICAK